MKFPFALFIVIAIALHGQAQASMDAPVPSTLLIADSYIVTFKRGSLSVPPLVLPVDPQNLTKIIPKFGENGTGQSKEALANSLGVKGVVVSIFETINAAGIQMSASEAEKLRKDPRVLRVEQNMTGSVQTTQLNPGWGLDRIDQSSINLNNQYIYNADGTGQTVYILDTGLDLTNPLVVAEFGSRATVSWDVNNSTGQDCNGHGTRVASLVGATSMGWRKVRPSWWKKLPRAAREIPAPIPGRRHSTGWPPMRLGAPSSISVRLCHMGPMHAGRLQLFKPWKIRFGLPITPESSWWSLLEMTVATQRITRQPAFLKLLSSARPIKIIFLRGSMRWPPIPEQAAISRYLRRGQTSIQ